MRLLAVGTCCALLLGAAVLSSPGQVPSVPADADTNAAPAATNAPPAQPQNSTPPKSNAPPPSSAVMSQFPSGFQLTHPELSVQGKPEQPFTLHQGFTPADSVEALPDFAPSTGGDLGAHLLVVYNTKEPGSEGLARYYASKRGIPDERIFALDCPVSEEISRDDFENTVHEPITDYITKKGWMTRRQQRVEYPGHTLNLLTATHNDIWAIVLMRGVPLKIAPDPNNKEGMERQPELQTDAAAVDSELALLPAYGMPRGGYVTNPFFDILPGSTKHIGPELAKTLVLVTRLDGPKVEDVRRMIDDTLYAEEHRLAGLALIDTRGLTDVKDGYTMGDIWLRSARESLVKDGWTVEFDNANEVIPATDPCNRVAFYLGWYSQEAVGPLVTPPQRFVRGAIAYHLHSFSAATVRADNSHWVGPLIAHGAAATMGMVYEPYLALTPHLDIFTRRMLEGDYFAEAAYASSPGLSWMLTVVGDPLYRPFRLPLEQALAAASSPHTPQDDWLFLQKIRRNIESGDQMKTTSSLRRVIETVDAGPVAEEVLGDILTKLNDPEHADDVKLVYQKAYNLDTDPVDRIRVGIKLAEYYSTHGEGTRAQAQLDTLREHYPAEVRVFGVDGPLVPTSVPAPQQAAPAPAKRTSSNPPPSNSSARLPQLPQLAKPTPSPP